MQTTEEPRGSRSGCGGCFWSGGSETKPLLQIQKRTVVMVPRAVKIWTPWTEVAS